MCRFLISWIFTFLKIKHVTKETHSEAVFVYIFKVTVFTNLREHIYIIFKMKSSETPTSHLRIYYKNIKMIISLLNGTCICYNLANGFLSIHIF